MILVGIERNGEAVGNADELMRLIDDLYLRLTSRKHCVICGAFGSSNHMSPDKRHRRGGCGEITCPMDAFDNYYNNYNNQ